LAGVLHRAAQLAGYQGRLPATIRPEEVWRIYAGLAVLSKADVRGREQDFSSGHGMPATTSGTTGTPLKLLRSPRCVLMEAAWTSHCRGWAGYRHGQPIAVIRGTSFPEGGAAVPHRWTLQRQLLLSSDRLSESTAAEYVELLRRHHIRWIAAYPSSITSLTVLCLSRGIEVPQISGIFTSSETLTSEMRRAVESAWGCKIWDFYGNAERTVAAAQCEVGRYHILPGYAVVEKVPAGLVTTSLLNKAMPLVRYEVPDHVEDWTQNPCTCERIGPTMAAVLGREDDIVFGADNRRIALLGNVVWGVKGVLASQFVQEERGALTVRVVPDFDRRVPGFEDDLRARVIRRTGPIRVSVQVCSELERLPSGKVAFVIQRTERDGGENLA
jgi:phenylacetate-CoA ligase